MSTNTYSGDPSTSSKDAVRFVISDTASPWKFTDEEINYQISQTSNINVAAGELAFRMAGKYIDRRDKTVGPLSIKYGEIADRWYKFVAEIKSRSSRRGGARAIYGNVRRAPHFTIGMHDMTRWADESRDLLGLERELVVVHDNDGVDGGDIDE